MQHPVIFPNFAEKKQFLTEGLDAQVLRLRTMAGWVLNRVSSISPLIMPMSAPPSVAYEEKEATDYSLMINWYSL